MKELIEKYEYMIERFNREEKINAGAMLNLIGMVINELNIIANESRNNKAPDNRS